MCLLESAKGADGRRQTGKELHQSLGGEPDPATVLRVFPRRPVYLKLETIEDVGRILVGIGLLLVCLGVVVMLLERLHLPLGRLPGDIVFRSKGGTSFFPLMTCILLSALATLVLWLFNRR